MSEVNVDFIAKDPWRMVLVEEGPWDDIAANLRRVQDRLYSCVEAAIDGKLAEQFPESAGGEVVMRLDGYNLPIPEAEQFFDRFAASALESPDYKASLERVKAGDHEQRGEMRLMRIDSCSDSVSRPVAICGALRPSPGSSATPR
jgi:hypothetical protein